MKGIVTPEICELCNLFAKPCNTYTEIAPQFCAILEKFLIKVEKPTTDRRNKSTFKNKQCVSKRRFSSLWSKHYLCKLVPRILININPFPWAMTTPSILGWFPFICHHLSICLLSILTYPFYPVIYMNDVTFSTFV